MSMYKSIFVIGENDENGVAYTDGQEVMLGGKAVVFGETAFASVDKAVGSLAAGTSAIVAVVKVETGKYESFTIVTEGTAAAASKVVALDFDGGSIVTADGFEYQANASSEFTNEAQAALLADLNNRNASMGVVYIDAKDVVSADETLVLEWGGTNYVSGVNNVSGVTAKENMAELITNVTVPEISRAAGQLLVNSDYNSSTEGYGTSTFNNYSGALAYAKTNAKTSTIVFEKTTTLSGNCFDNDVHKNLTELAVEVRDGATAGNAASKWDMAYAVTIKAGGILQSARGTGSGVGNTHVKNTLTVGEEGADKEAYIKFSKASVNNSYQNMSIAVLYNGKLIANNANISVGDLGFTGAATIKDSNVDVVGVVAFGKNTWYKQTMTNTTMTVKGHNLMNENKYYSTEGNILKGLTMTNSSITVDDGVAGTSAEKVTINNLKMEKNSQLTVEAGTEVSVTGKLTMSDSGVSAGAITLNGGSITLDVSADKVAKTYGTYALINQENDSAAALGLDVKIAGTTYSMANKDEYSWTDANTGVFYKLHKGDGNDIILQSFASDLKVNSAYTSETPGYGFNAFSTLEEAAGKIRTDGADTTIKLESDLTVDNSIEFQYGTGDVVFEADSAVTVDQSKNGLDFAFTESKDMSVVVGENVTFKIKDNAAGWYMYYGPSLELYGTITGGENWGCGYFYKGSHNIYSTGTLSVGRTQVAFSDMTVNGDAANIRKQIDTNYLLVEGASFTANNTIVDANVIYDNNNGGQRWGASDFVFNNSEVQSSKITLSYKDSTMVVNNSTIAAPAIVNNGKICFLGDSGISGNNVTITNNYDFNIGYDVNDSSVEASFTVADGQTITFNGTSNPSIWMSGKSTLTIADGGTLNTVGFWNSVNGKRSYISGTLNAANDLWVRNFTITETGLVTAGSQVCIYNNEEFVINGKMQITHTYSTSSNLLLGHTNSSYGAKTKMTVSGAKASLEILAGTQAAVANINKDDAGNAAQLTIEDGASVLIEGTLTNDGVLSLDGESSITAETLAGSGTVKIDAADFAGGAKRIINLNGDSSLEGKVEISNVAEGVKVLYGKDGDVTLTDSDNSTLFVNSAYTGTAGDITEDGKIIGYNAYSGMDGIIADYGTYETRNQGTFHTISVAGDTVLESTASKTFFQTDSDVKFTATGEAATIDVSNTGAFYIIDTALPIGGAPEDKDFSDIATVTVDENVTLRGQFIRFGQNISSDDMEDGVSTRDGGAVNMVVDGKVETQRFSVAGGSTLLITEKGKLETIANAAGKTASESTLRTGGTMIVNGTGSDMAEAQWSGINYMIRNNGGKIELNNTYADIKGIRQNDDEDMLFPASEAQMDVNDSRLDAHYLLNIDASVFNINNSQVSFSDYLDNSAYLNIDKNSTLSVGGNFSNTGSVNTDAANTAVFDGKVTVGKTFTSENLVLNTGAIFAAKSITVENLTLNFNSSVSIGGGSIGTLTVIGELVPEDAKFVLAENWGSVTVGNISYQGGNYEIKESVSGLSGLQFFVEDGKLYVQDLGAARTGIYIGDLSDAVDGKIVINGAEYIVGETAFGTAKDAADAAAAGTVDFDTEDITSTTLGSGDHISDLEANGFTAVDTLIIGSKQEVVDTAEAIFDNGLMINNAGHLEANIGVDGDLFITNSAVDTLVGKYAAWYMNIDNNGGKIENAVLEADEVVIDGGKGISVTVDASTLTLSNIDMELVGGMVLSDTFAQINMDENTKLTIAGDGLTVNSYIYGISSVDGSVAGSVVMAGGTQTYTGAVEADSIMINSDAKVTASDLLFSSLTVDGELTADFTGFASYSDGGVVDGSGTIKAAHNGMWIINDTVSRDFSGFTGTVALTGTGAGIAMGLGDMGTADSYFADGTTVVLGGGQSAMLSEDGKATGIVFEGQGDLNVGMMKRNSSKAIEVTDVNAGFKQTLTADNSSFEGTANVAEGATLTLKGNFGGHVNLDVNAAGTQATTLELAGNGIDVAGTITGDANDIVAVNDDAVLSGTGALNSFYGTVDVAAGKQLDLNAANTTDAILNGSTTAKVNVNADTVLNGTGALDGFYGQVAVADAADTLSLSGVNDTDALFTGAGNISTSANQTFGAAALNGFTGKVALGADLTLDGANTTSATVTGATTITADSAKQEFTGDVSGFTGTFVATGSDVKLSGTFANAINANGTGSLTLGDKTQAVQVNAGTGTLATLNFGNNTLTVGTGSFTDINGTGSVYFTKNDSFNSIAAKDVNLTSSNGWNITVNTLTADINLTIDAAQTDSTADVTVNGAFGKNINVSVTDTSAIPNGSFYKLVGADSFTITGITLTVGTDSGVLALGQSIKLGGFTYQLRENAGVWELGQRAGNSNIVVVNALWTADPYATVDDNGLDRSIGFDAAMNIDKAVSYIRGYAEGQGWSEGTNTGDAKIELAVNATYTIGDDVYLMTADNKVTQLTLEGRNGGTVASDILGTDGSINGTLTIVNLNTTRDIFAGGNLIIDNESSNTARGSYLAGGTETGAAAGDTSVTLKGGSYSFRHIAGGSILTTAAAAVVSDKNSKVVIANETTGNLVVSGNLTGGSVSCEGSLTVNGTSTLEINVGDGSKGVTQIRGNIYAAGIADNGDLTVNGDAKVIFTGDASDLRFTGRVYGGAFNGSTFNGKSDLEFKDFNGAFNGNILDFNTITISGSSTLEIARRQTGTAETAINFVVNAATGSDAMYTVRDANSWEFAKNITVDVDNAQNGTYVLVDNYAGGYSDFNVSVGGAACSVGQSVYVGNDKYTVVARNNQLQLTVAKGDGYTGGDLTGSVAVSDMIVTGKITGASVDISGTSAVQSGISSPNSTALTLNIADNSDATIEGGIVGKGSDTISVGDNAQVTITGGIQTTGGNDSIVIGTNSNVEITGEVKATSGDDSIVIGDGSTVEIKGTDRIYLGNGQNSTVVGKNASLIVGGLLEGSGTLEIGKGGTVQTKGCESVIFVTMDVDSVLNNTSAIQSGIKVDVVGVSDLVLNDAADADIAGVKAVYHGCSSIQDNAKLKVDGVDMVLGSAKQIQGADTTETTDDVWASLNRVGNDLVVAWGRSEAEVGVALTAFGDGTSLVLGESFTATATTLSDSNPDNDFQKKSQGTLA